MRGSTPPQEMMKKNESVSIEAFLIDILQDAQNGIFLFEISEEKFSCSCEQWAVGIFLASTTT